LTRASSGAGGHAETGSPDQVHGCPVEESTGKTKPESVTRGLDPRVHSASGAMDARVKPGHDAEKESFWQET
jgi:hypothetical protein